MFTFGTDPEFFLKKNDIILNAIDILEGDPDHRLKIDKYELYHDNVLAEIAVPPSHSREEAIQILTKGMNILQEVVNPCEISFLAYYKFNSRYLRSFEAKLAACNPDWCAYQIEMKRPEDTELKYGKWVFTTNARTAGGHIHLGIQDLKSELEMCKLVRLLDIFLGVPSVIFDHSNETKNRRKIYGQPGRFRVKDYGIEYRTLGNWWLEKEEYIGLVYDLCENAIDIWRQKASDFLEDDLNSQRKFKVKYNQSEIIDTIKSANPEKARTIIKRYLDYYPSKLQNSLLSGKICVE